MDNMSPLFSIENVDDLLQLSPLPCLQQDINFDHNQHLPILSKENLNESDRTPKPKSRKRNRSSARPSDENDHQMNPEDKEKKIIHRDIERLRRQEMATLYASLRALLPRDFLKGKRSVCDHMNEAVNYIKHLQGMIQVISNKRDELRKLSRLFPTDATENMKNSLLDDSVMVRPTWEGVEIILEISMNNGLSLSRVLGVLGREDLEIISCNSTRTNEGLLHIVETKVENGGDINLSELQQKLANLIYFSFDQDTDPLLLCRIEEKVMTDLVH